MKIKIVFYKSSSKYYDSACLRCEGIGAYSQDKNVNTLVVDIADIKKDAHQFFGIVDTVKNWSKTEFYINDEQTTAQKIESLLPIIHCENNCSNCIAIDEHCYEDMGWGCKFIESIALRQKSYYSRYGKWSWYEIGHFKADTWVVDKARILDMLTREITDKHLSICSHFAIERVKNAVNVLPDFIEVSETDECKWEYKYREAPLGLNQTEIIGIKTKETSSNSSGFGFSISIGGKSADDAEDQIQKKTVPSVTFADIGGIDEIVQQIREVIELPLIAPQIFEHYRIKPHKGILLYGPPGCGKTLIAKAIANEINAHFIAVNGPEILNKYVGQSEANLRKVFEEAKKYSPSVIYFDEFDSISSTRDAEGNPLMATVVNQLLTLMDGVDEADRICAIASTNRIDMIDEAVRRPGRFDYVIEIKKPTPEGCKAIFRIHTAKMPIEKSFNRDKFVEANLIGCSGADIAFVASEAAYNSIRRTVDIARAFAEGFVFEVSDDNIITGDDFERAVQLLKESRKRANTAKFRYNV